MNGIDIAIGFFGLLAVLLAFSGTTIGETALAFGGDRWTESSAPFYRRITPRGWISLLCLFIAIGLITMRKDMQEQDVKTKIATITELEENASRLEEQIKKYVTDIVQLKGELSQAQASVANMTEHVETHQMQSMEAAFQLTAKMDQEIDEAVVSLDGRPRVPIPSRYLSQMRLAGGDRFYFATFLQNPSSRDLRSLQLEMGEKVYPLFIGDETGFSEKTLRLPGNPFKTVPAYIQNPLLLNKMTLKIVIRPKEMTSEEDAFRQLVLNSPFSEVAKKKYKLTKADILNVRSEATVDAQLVERLRRNSYVRILQKEEEWVEIMTAKGKQGWVIGRFLTEIK